MQKYIIFSEIDDHFEVIFVSEETYAHMLNTCYRYEEEK